MNPVDLQRGILRLASALVVAGSIFLAACGGSSSSTETAGIGGTGIGVGGTGIVVGKITGFGSVLVNGGTFDIDTSQFNVDGNTSANQGDLSLGMVITLEVEIENGVYTGQALKVVYDDQVEGPVTTVDPQVDTTKIVHVFGQNITIDETSTVFDGTSFENIGNEDNPGLLDVIEVSGFRTSPTEIVATYVRFDEDLVTGTTAVEVRGTVDNYIPGGTTFEIEFDGTVINFDPTGVTTEIDVPGAVISNGMYVEVEGVIEADQSVTADKIEAEDEDLGDDVDDVSLQGIVVVYNGVDDFVIGNQPVDASTAEFKPASLEGMDLLGLNIEVEGEIVNGTLIADEVEARDGDTELRAPISSVGGNSFQVTYPVATSSTTVVVNTNGQTLFEDEGPLQLPNFSVADLMVGDYVIVEGTESGNEVIADTVKRKDSADPDDSKLEGQVDAFVDVPIPTSITVLGITFPVDGNTDYEDATGIVSSTVFFNQLQVDDIVEIKDEEPADGIADEVELE